MIDSPAAVLFDVNGNKIGTILDGENYRLQVESSVPTQIKTEYDLSNPLINYIGTAPSGTATSASGWVIKKINFDISGNPTEILWSSNTAIWDNRISEIYS